LPKKDAVGNRPSELEEEEEEEEEEEDERRRRRRSCLRRLPRPWMIMGGGVEGGAADSCGRR
jgi:hypothetical protein